MTYARPTWKFAAETHLLKLQRVENRVLRTIGNFPRLTSIHAYSFPSSVRLRLHDKNVQKTSRNHSRNHGNENVRNIGQGETPHRKYKRLKLGGGHVYDRSNV
jgi:hypothetical protein